jgi:hypothetical protein
VSQIRNGAHALWRFLIGVFAVATLVQVVLAGYGVFSADDEGKNKTFDKAFEAHGGLGFFMTVGALLILLLALIAWREPRIAAESGILFVLMIVQSVLAGLGGDHPIVGAFHPLVGFAIVGFSWFLFMARVKGKGQMHHHHGTEPAPPPPA